MNPTSKTWGAYLMQSLKAFLLFVLGQGLYGVTLFVYIIRNGPYLNVTEASYAFVVILIAWALTSLGMKIYYKS